MSKKIKKIYHYAPMSPAFTVCRIKECNYYYTTEKHEVTCPDCKKFINKIRNEIYKYELKKEKSK